MGMTIFFEPPMAWNLKHAYCKIKINNPWWLKKKEKRASQIPISNLSESINGKQKRSIKAILQKKVAGELEDLQAVDTTYFSISKSAAIHKNKFIQVQEKRTKVVEGAKKSDSIKLTNTSSCEGEKGKSQFSEDDAARLIYARTYVDQSARQSARQQSARLISTSTTKTESGQWYKIFTMADVFFLRPRLFFPCPSIFFHVQAFCQPISMFTNRW